MVGPGQRRFSVFGSGPRAAALGLAFAIAFLLAFGPPAAPAQTFQVIHNFTGLGDGSEPNYGITIDTVGNLYGTTFSGDALTGTVYKLALKGSSWVLSPLYLFTYQGIGGSIPYATVIQGRDGSLYGTAAYGGDLQACPNGATSGCGTVFNLRPLPSIPATPLTPWKETVIHTFHNTDGANAYGGDLIFDNAGNIYGTTYHGGTGTCPGGCGVVYELTPAGGGNWTQTVLYNFKQGSGDGTNPWTGVIFDQAGNLYGTTVNGGASGAGAVYELSPSGLGWTEKVIYSFSGGADGLSPYAGLVFDQSGNLYGATVGGGTGNGGTVFKLTPSGGTWTLSTLYTFLGTGGQLAGGPFGRVLLGSNGNIYGAAFSDGLYGFGAAFKLTPSGGGYTYTSLHDFTGGLDGGHPRSYLVMDKNGNLYGATTVGGTGNPTNCVGACGVVYEITP